MHTAARLKADMFEVEIGAKSTSVSELLDWGAFDRLGVIVNAPLGGLGASLLIQLAITGFYDVPERKRRQTPSTIMKLLTLLFPTALSRKSSIILRNRKQRWTASNDALPMGARVKPWTRTLLSADTATLCSKIARERLGLMPMLAALAEKKLRPLQQADNERILKSYCDRAAEIPSELREKKSERFDEAQRGGGLKETYRRVDIRYALNRLRRD